MEHLLGARRQALHLPPPKVPLLPLRLCSPGSASFSTRAVVP